jgi:hypothetical protein
MIALSQGFVSLLGTAAFIESLNWVIAALLVLSLAPEIVLKMKYSDSFYSWYRKSTTTEREAWYYHLLLTAPDQAKGNRLFSLGSFFADHFLTLSRGVRKGRLRFIQAKGA